MIDFLRDFSGKRLGEHHAAAIVADERKHSAPRHKAEIRNAIERERAGHAFLVDAQIENRDWQVHADLQDELRLIGKALGHHHVFSTWVQMHKERTTQHQCARNFVFGGHAGGRLGHCANVDDCREVGEESVKFKRIACEWRLARGDRARILGACHSKGATRFRQGYQSVRCMTVDAWDDVNPSSKLSANDNALALAA